MNRDNAGDSADAAGRLLGAPTTRVIARGDGWKVSEFTCTLGPRDRRFEERHDDVAISGVGEGAFQYRSANGRALLSPGAYLRTTPVPVATIAFDSGFGDLSTFKRHFRQAFGVTPTAFRGRARLC